MTHHTLLYYFQTAERIHIGKRTAKRSTKYIAIKRAVRVCAKFLWLWIFPSRQVGEVNTDKHKQHTFGSPYLLPMGVAIAVAPAAILHIKMNK